MEVALPADFRFQSFKERRCKKKKKKEKNEKDNILPCSLLLIRTQRFKKGRCKKKEQKEDKKRASRSSDKRAC